MNVLTVFTTDLEQEYTVIEDIKCYAPDVAHANHDFPAEGFEALFRYEATNFWFLSRNQVLLTLLKRFSGDKAMSFLEIGCGTGYVLKAIGESGPHTITGAEIHVEGLRFAKIRLPDAELIQLDATRMPFRNRFDAVGAFDVLEHIDQDTLVMEQVRLSLKPGGHFYITVPQYPFMWSYLDDIAFHKRRYVRKELRSKLEKAGFKVRYIGSFVFSLFPFMLLSRLAKKSKPGDAIQENMNRETEMAMPSWMNSLFRFVLRIDEILIRMGISLPFGGSLVAVAQRTEQE